MLDIFLRILPVLGIIFLIVLALLVISLFLVLFFPIAYRFSASRDLEGVRAAVKLKWLFGLLRVRYQYPQPGHIIAKALWFPLYDSKFPAPRENETPPEKDEESSGKKTEKKKMKKASKKAGESSDPRDEKTGKAAEKEIDQAAEKAENDTAEEGTAGAGKVIGAGESGQDSKFFQKIAKIKYTICSICDKIKEIWENISYYTELLQEEDTKQLFADVLLRSGAILKNIRPRHIKARILFGTGSPDTTGYIYGVYCMLSSVLNYDRTWVTPDFENAVLEGEVEISGHITLWVLLVNGVRLVLDKRLKKFVGRVKARKKDS